MNELHSLMSQNNVSQEEHSGMGTDEFQVQHLLWIIEWSLNIFQKSQDLIFDLYLSL